MIESYVIYTQSIKNAAPQVEVQEAKNRMPTFSPWSIFSTWYAQNISPENNEPKMRKTIKNRETIHHLKGVVKQNRCMPIINIQFSSDNIIKNYHFDMLLQIF